LRKRSISLRFTLLGPLLILVDGYEPLLSSRYRLHNSKYPIRKCKCLITINEDFVCSCSHKRVLHSASDGPGRVRLVREPKANDKHWSTSDSRGDLLLCRSFLIEYALFVAMVAQKVLRIWLRKSRTPSVFDYISWETQPLIPGRGGTSGRRNS
jgi:hypothetical protein